MQVLSGRCGDAEGLLHETVGFVPVSFRLPVVLVFVATATGIRSLASASSSAAEPTTSLALHLPVRQEAPGNAAGTPGLAVCPSSHASFPLVPHKYRTRSNRLSFLLGESSLHSGQYAEPTGLKQLDGVGGRPHVAVICFHSAGDEGVQFSRLTQFDKCRELPGRQHRSISKDVLCFPKDHGSRA